MELSIESILRCPLTHSPLMRPSDAEVNRLNQQVSAGELVHLDGTLVKSRMETALLAENGAFAYPVVEGIYVLMPNLAIVLDPEGAKKYRSSLVQEKIDMVAFYDQLGWQQSENERFVDAARFEDLRPVSRDYIHQCHARLSQYFSPSGDFLLDIASGPVQYSEYEAYSKQYKHRICADISLVALQEARKKLGDHGVYLLCDVTNIPLSDNAVDAFLSLHTLYHVPATEQILAFAELQRVLKSDRTGVVVYSWGKRALLMRFFEPWLKLQKWSRRFLVGLRQKLRGIPDSDAIQKKPIKSDIGIEKPYFYTHTYAWVCENLTPLGYPDIACWRSVSVPFLRSLVQPWLFGKTFLAMLFWFEGRFKHFFARYGQYPILICRK